MFDEYDDILTVDDLQKMLHIGRNTAYTLINSGKLKSTRIGRQIRIRKADVIAHLTHYDNSELTKNKDDEPTI